MRLFHWIMLRHSSMDPIRYGLSGIGVAIGVGVFIAIKLANFSALAAFESTVDYVNGKANVQLIPKTNRGFSERTFGQIAVLKEQYPEIVAATPVVERLVRVGDSLGQPYSTPLSLLGIDLFTDGQFRNYDTKQNADPTAFLRFLQKPNSIYLSKGYSTSAGIEVGNTLSLLLQGTWVTVTVEALLEQDDLVDKSAQGVAIMDIEQAQRLLGMKGRLDRIDLIVTEKRRQEIIDFLSNELPAEIEVVSAKNRGAQVAAMIDAFELNLTALSFITLMVAFFIIYNAVLTNAVRRRKEIGIVKSLGLSSTTVVWLFITDGIVLGLWGSVLGIGLGLLLAELLLSGITKTISALYIYVAATTVSVSWNVLLQGFLLGVITAALSAALPGAEVKRVHPKETFNTQFLEDHFSLSFRKNTIFALLLLSAACISSFLPSVNGTPIFGYFGAILLMMGVALCSPQTLTLVEALTRTIRVKWLGAEAWLGGKFLIESLRRSATAVNALMVAVAMLVGVTVMVGSFRETVTYWLNQSLQADIYVSPGERFAVGSGSELSPALTKAFSTLAGIKEIEAFSSYNIKIDQHSAVIAASNLAATGKASRISFLEGMSERIIESAIEEKSSVIISEALSHRIHKTKGDTLHLPTPLGLIPVVIKGVYYDYASDRGVITMHRPHFQSLWGDSTIHTMAIYLDETYKMSEVIAQLYQLSGDETAVSIQSNAVLRESVLSIFDQTFRVTYILQLIAMMVAGLGIVTSLGAIVFERRRELAILKTIGTTASQIQMMVLVQSFFIGLTAVVLGILCGLGLSLILIYVVNLQSFGWSIQFYMPWGALGLTAIGVLITAVVSGWFPANYATRLSIAEEIRYE